MTNESLKTIITGNEKTTLAAGYGIFLQEAVKTTPVDAAILVENLFASIPETNTGTETFKAVTPDGLEGSIYNVSRETEASNATPTPAIVGFKHHMAVTALAVNATFGAPTGKTPQDGDILIIRILDDGTGRTLAFHAIYDDPYLKGEPTTTTANKEITLGYIYNAVRVKYVLQAFNEVA